MDLLSLDDSAAPTEQAKASVSNSDGELELLLCSYTLRHTHGTGWEHRVQPVTATASLHAIARCFA